MTTIRALTQADLPEAQRIVRVAFGTFLGAPDPEKFWSDLDYVYGGFGAEATWPCYGIKTAGSRALPSAIGARRAKPAVLIP